MRECKRKRNDLSVLENHGASYVPIMDAIVGSANPDSLREMLCVVVVVVVLLLLWLIFCKEKIIVTTQTNITVLKLEQKFLKGL